MNNRLLQLVRGDLVDLRDARGTTLKVARGALWVTQHRGVADVTLSAGDAWTVERSGTTLAEVQSDAAVLVIGNAAAAVVRTARPRWDERLLRWLEATGEHRWRRAPVPHY